MLICLHAAFSTSSTPPPSPPLPGAFTSGFRSELAMILISGQVGVILGMMLHVPLEPKHVRIKQKVAVPCRFRMEHDTFLQSHYSNQSKSFAEPNHTETPRSDSPSHPC